MKMKAEIRAVKYRCCTCGKVFDDFTEAMTHVKETGHWPLEYIYDYGDCCLTLQLRTTFYENL